MTEEDITVEERPEGIYVCFEGAKVGPYESGLAALARHEQIAEVLNCYPEDVRQALLSFKPTQDGIVRVVEYAGDDAVSLVYDGRWLTGYFKPYEAEQAELFFAEWNPRKGLKARCLRAQMPQAQRLRVWNPRKGLKVGAVQIIIAGAYWILKVEPEKGIESRKLAKRKDKIGQVEPEKGIER